MDTLICTCVWALAVWVGLPTVSTAKGRACDWIVCNRGHTRDTFSCENSVIFVENVTGFHGEANHVAYQNIKQMCMGASSCDPTRICMALRQQLLRVRYICVNVSPIPNKCKWPVETFYQRKGNIWSPNYPAAFPSESCSWRVVAPEDRFVHISVHDMSLLAPSPYCDIGLNMTYQHCSTGHVKSSLFCGNLEDRSDLIACGSVSIQLIANVQGEGVRFWLSYEVTSSPEAAVRPPLLKFVGRCTQGIRAASQVLASRVLERPVLRSLDADIAMPSSMSSSNVASTTVASAVTSVSPTPDPREIDIKVVIIVVSTIGSVLLMAIILAVIFLKRPKVERVENVYAVPTPRESSVGTGSSVTLKHERPVLRECYCEVADAIPSSRLTTNPASPGYAEVEDVCKGDTCRWNPHKFTFGPTIRVPDYLYSDQSNFPTSGPYLTGSPMHMRTLSDSTPLRTSPYLAQTALARSFRDPKSTDYEEVIIDNQRHSPRFVHKDQQNLLQSRLSRATAAARGNTPYGVECVPVKPSEGLYATSNVINNPSHVLYPHKETHLSKDNKSTMHDSPSRDKDSRLVLKNKFQGKYVPSDYRVPFKGNYGAKDHVKSNSKGVKSLTSASNEVKKPTE